MSRVRFNVQKVFLFEYSTSLGTGREPPTRALTDRVRH